MHGEWLIDFTSTILLAVTWLEHPANIINEVINSPRKTQCDMALYSRGLVAEAVFL